MSDLLAIVDPAGTDEELIAEIIRRHPDRVTFLVETHTDADLSPDSPRGLALRTRLSTLRATIEAGSGAVVVGLATGAEQLRGWRFDRVVGARRALPV